MRIYVAKRAFKTNGEFYDVGSVVDPAKIRYFKSKIQEGQIILLNSSDANLEDTLDYLEIRAGKPLKKRYLDILRPTKKEPAKTIKKEEAKSKSTSIRKAKSELE